MDPAANIQIVFKPRLHKSWRVKWNRGEGSCELHLPPSLEHAPESVKSAVLQWADLVTRGRNSRFLRRNRPETLLLRRECEKKVQDFLHNWLENSPTSSAENTLRKQLLSRNARKIHRLNPIGRHHDLRRIFADINREYFEGSLEASITWSSRIGGLSTHSIQRDGEGKPYHLISISRGYDVQDAGPEIVGGVVYHECLHIVFPPRWVEGRRIVHSAEFQQAEKRYRHFEAWRHWHRHELPRKIRFLLREKSKTEPSTGGRLLKSWMDYLRMRKTAR